MDVGALKTSECGRIWSNRSEGQAVGGGGARKGWLSQSHAAGGERARGRRGAGGVLAVSRWPAEETGQDGGGGWVVLGAVVAVTARQTERRQASRQDTVV